MVEDVKAIFFSGQRGSSILTVVDDVYMYSTFAVSAIVAYAEFDVALVPSPMKLTYYVFSNALHILEYTRHTTYNIA